MAGGGSVVIHVDEVIHVRPLTNSGMHVRALKHSVELTRVPNSQEIK